MTDPHAFLANLALVLCTAGVTTVMSRRLRLPGVFGYLVAGMVVGPHTPLPLFADPDTVRTLSELGVILLMYSLGLEFRLGHVLRVGATAGLAALAETSLMFALGYAVATTAGWSPLERLFTGAIVAISSTTIIARTFAERGIAGRLKDVVFGILVAEDLIAILLIALLSAVAGGGSVSGGALARTTIELVTFLVASIAIGRALLPRLVGYVERLGHEETLVVVVVGLAFGAALVARAFGYSVALGAFIAGSLVAESGRGEALERRIAPVRDLFVAIFFVSVGMLIEPAVVAEHWGAVLALTAVVIAGKFLAVSAGAFLTGSSLTLAIQAGLSLTQVGEFSFIIAGVGLATGATGSFLYAVAIAVSTLTTLTTPLLVGIAPRVAQTVDRRLPRALQTYVALYGSWFAGLTNAGRLAGHRGLAQASWLILLDVALLCGLVVASAVEMDRLAPRLESWLQWPAPSGRWGVGGLALVAASPFVAGLVRMTRFVAGELALRALPRPAGRALDRAAAPRGAFVSTLQYAMLLACAIPLLAILQPVAPGAPLLGVFGLLAVLAAVAVWRSAAALYGHARAGAEVIAMALTQHHRSDGTSEELAHTMDHVAALLPGLGDPSVVRLAEGDQAVGRTLGDLNLRGDTGATVLVILRRDDHEHVPIGASSTERLRAGDLLTIAGSQDAMRAARERLRGPQAMAHTRPAEAPLGPAPMPAAGDLGSTPTD